MRPNNKVSSMHKCTMKYFFCNGIFSVISMQQALISAIDMVVWFTQSLKWILEVQQLAKIWKPTFEWGLGLFVAGAV